MSSIVGSFKDAANPFVRLVNSATTEDGNLNVPYYQVEEIREASFQSEYAAESIHRALLQRLEYINYPFIVSKTLCVMRVLMLEGPAGFNHKMGAATGKLLQIINNTNEVRRGTVEERNKELAAAIHQAISGDSKALIRFGSTESTATAKSAYPQQQHGTAAGGKAPSHKSEFQQQQDREQRAHRKRMEEEKSRGAIVMNDRLLDSFDGSLPPHKLVECVTASPKKRFAAEEIESFVAAALQTEKVEQVCAALDAVLRDGRASLQNRFKILTMAEALVSASGDAQQFFKSHCLGWQRHMSIERADNPAKAEAAKAVAQRISAVVANAVPQLATRPRGNSAASSAAASATSGAVPQQQPTPAGGGRPGSKPPPTQQQWEWNGPSAVPTSAASLDDLFSNMSVRPSPAAVVVPPNGGQGIANNYSTNVSTAPSAPHQDPWSHYSATITPQQQQQRYVPSPALSHSAPAVPNNSMMQSSFTELPPAPNSSFAGHVPATYQQPQVPQPLTPEEQLRRQMEEFQKMMAMMMQHAQQQQQQTSVPQQPQQQAAPPQPPQHVVPPPASPDPQQQQQQAGSSPAGAVTPSPQPSHSLADAEAEHQARSPSREHHTTDDTIAACTADSPPPAEQVLPTVGPSSDQQRPGNEAAIAMMLQLQQQMEATQRMLSQQQAAFQALQAQLMGSQPSPQ